MRLANECIIAVALIESFGTGKLRLWVSDRLHGNNGQGCRVRIEMSVLPTTQTSQNTSPFADTYPAFPTQITLSMSALA
jgi:hypothetical protein